MSAQAGGPAEVFLPQDKRLARQKMNKRDKTYNV
jgi:uncharacterized 2Fe-2S/4Fe-4S cluster protein (DUF4445 family)